MKNYAFFDVDGTLLNTKTMFSFQKYFFLEYIKTNKISYEIKYFFSRICMQYYIFSGKSRKFLNKKFYESFAGIDKCGVKLCAYEWYSHLKTHQKNLFIPETLAALKNHQHAGDDVIFVSGSSLEILAPIAEDLGVKYILATSLEEINNKFTGKINHPQTIGVGKKIKIINFLKNATDEIQFTYGYGDDDSDIPMLSITDFPTILPGNIVLERYADTRQWRKLMPI